MPKTTRNLLRDKQLQSADLVVPKAGLRDGGNLHLLRMPETGLLKWRVFYRLRGKATTIWIGEYPKVKLADARKRRDEIEEMAGKGVDPKQVRKGGKAPSTGMTFKQFVEAHGEDLAPQAPKARKEWLAAMTGKVGALADMTPGEITGADIAEVMKPIWLQSATAKKRLNGIATVLRAARARGLIKTPGWTNPADYRSSFSGVMKKPKHDEKGREALPIADVPDFVAELRSAPGALALGLEWIVLTAAREMEGMTAEWPEINRETLVWTIPAHKTKTKREHKVPLSKAMLDVLDRAAKHGATGFIFPAPGCKAGHFESGRAIDLLRKLRPGTATVHGFRSAMFDWSQEATDYSDRLANAALAHAKKTEDENGKTQIADKAQAAYDRSTLLEKRRPLMQDWGDYCTARCVVAANADVGEAVARRAA